MRKLYGIITIIEETENGDLAVLHKNIRIEPKSTLIEADKIQIAQHQFNLTVSTLEGV